MSIAAISLSGMRAQQTRLAAAASNLANQSTPGYTRLQASLTTEPTGGVSATLSATSPQPGGIDPLTEMVEVITAGNEFAANAAAWETGAEIWDVLLSIVRD